MTYELAKELKEAGFPKDGFEYEESIPEVQVAPGVSIPGDAPRWRNLPTLSELIEACGDGFYALKNYREPDVEWVAMTDVTVPQNHYGKTPEEAVARLYIALNKK